LVTRVVLATLIVAVVVTAALTGAFILTQAPKTRQLVAVTRYVGGLAADEAPYYAADVEGYYTQNGIALTPVILSGGVAATQAVAADNTGFAFVFGSIFTLVLLESKNPNSTSLISVASLGSVNPTGVLYLKSSGISKPSDLVGKRIGLAMGSQTAAIFQVFLERNGLENQVQLENIAISALPAALLAKRVDAIVSFASNYGGLSDSAKQVDDEIGYFLLSDYGMPPLGLGLVVQTRLVHDHPDVVRAIVNATLEGVKFCIIDTAQCVADFVKVNPTFSYEETLETMELTWNLTYGPPFNDRTRVQNLEALQLGWHDPSKVAEEVALAEEAFGITASIDVNSIYTNEFVKPP